MNQTKAFLKRALTILMVLLMLISTVSVGLASASAATAPTMSQVYTLDPETGQLVAEDGSTVIQQSEGGTVTMKPVEEEPEAVLSETSEETTEAAVEETTASAEAETQPADEEIEIIPKDDADIAPVGEKETPSTQAPANEVTESYSYEEVPQAEAPAPEVSEEIITPDKNNVADMGANVEIAETGWDQSACTVYFDAEGWTTTNRTIYLLIGHGSWSSCYAFTKVGGTIYSCSVPQWGGASEWYIICADSGWGDEGSSPSNRKNWAYHASSQRTSALTANTVYTSSGTVSSTTCTVTFKNWDGTVLKTQSVYRGANATAPSNPTRAATAQYTYTFKGWDTTFTNVRSNLTVTATYTSTVNNYTLTLARNNTSGGSVSGAGTYAYNTKVTIKATPATGYSFTGWTKNSGNSPASTSAASTTVTLTQTTKLTANFAINTYKLTLAASPTAGGTVTGAGTYNYNTKVTIKATPATGYYFNGWTKNSGNSPASTSAASTTVTLTQATSLTANFKKYVYNLTVSASPSAGGYVELNGQTELTSVDYSYGYQPTLKAVANTGYKFTGWTYTGSKPASTTAASTSVTVTSKTTITANFEKINYTVTMSAGTGGQAEAAATTVAYNNTTTVTATPNTGYSFSKWEITSGSGTLSSATANPATLTVKGNVTVKATFKINTYTLTLNKSTGGSVEGAGTYNYNTKVTITATPSTGYSFSGWTVTSGNSPASTSAASTTVTLTKNTTLKANFTINTYKLTLTAGTGGAVEGAGTYNYNTAVTIKATPSTGYIFSGWTVNSGNTPASTSAASTTVTLTKATSLTANFTDDRAYIAGSFNDWTSTLMTLSSGSTYTKSYTLDPGTYTFKFIHRGNWYGNNGGVPDTTDYNGGSNPWETYTDAGDITLNATGGTYKFTYNVSTHKMEVEYTPYTYTVTFKNGDGTTLETQTVAIGKYASPTKTPTKAQTAQYTYTFTGWDKDPATTAITANTTFTPQFSSTVRSYTVTFKNGDGSTLDTKTVQYGSYASTTKTPTKAATAQYTYTFTGWDKDPASTKITGATTFTPQFSSTVNKYTVTFKNGDGTTLETQSVAYGSYASPTKTPTKAQTAQYTYTFTGWDKDPASTKITGATTFTPQFSSTLRKYTVTFLNGDGSTLETQSIAYGSKATPTKTPTKAATAQYSYTFSGWDKDPASTTITGATIFTPKFTSTVNKYTLTLNKSTGGSVSGAGSYDYNTKVSITATPSTGYTFTGWTKTSGNSPASTSAASTTVTLTQNTTLKANFTINTYSVTFKNYDGSTLATRTVEHGSAATAPTVPARSDGWVFIGWDNDFSNITGPLTVTAQFRDDNVYLLGVTGSWTKGDAGTIMTYGDVSTMTLTLSEGTYTFKFIYNDAWLGNNGSFNDTTDYNGASNPWETYDGNDITLNALGGTYTFKFDKSNNKFEVKHTPITYTVTFKNWDGTTLSTQTVNKGSSATAPANPTRPATAQYTYTFKAWDTDFTNVRSNLTVTATYTSTVNKYTVTFKDYDGTTLGTSTVEYGKAATAPANPTRTGYTFKAWDKAFNNITGDLTVTATYTINTYTVTFKDWNNTTLATRTVEYGKAATAPADPTRTGYTFSGWDKAFNNITDDLTVTAQYTINKYTVTFKNWDNTTLATRTVEYNKAATAPADPTRAADAQYTYTFSGWDKDFSKITSNLTVTAQYSAIKNKYTVKFVDHDGSLLKSQSIEYGSSASAPTDPTRSDGWVFIGWDKDFSNITGALTVTAQYRDDNVYLMGVTGSWTKGDAGTIMTYGANTATMSLHLSEGNYEFKFIYNDVWLTNTGTVSDTTVYDGVAYTWETYQADQNITLAATGGTYTFKFHKSNSHFEVLFVPDSYTVTFKNWDGTTLATGEVKRGESASSVAPSKTPTRPASAEYTYTFKGWDKSLDNIQGDTTFTAQFTATKNKYNVTFNNWDGTKITTVSVEYGSAATAPADPTRTGYTFTGWDKSFANITGPLTVTAQFTINKYTVKFVDWDGSTIATCTVEYNKAATAPDAPTRTDGWTFIGWDKDYSQITSDLTVTALYRDDNLYLNGSFFDNWSYKEPMTVSGNTATFTVELAPGTYEFKLNKGDSWYGNDGTISDTTDYNGASNPWEMSTSAGNVTLDATGGYYTFTYNTLSNTLEVDYEPYMYTVEFRNWDGTLITTQQVAISTAATAPSNPTRPSTAQYEYTFKGWDKDFSNITGNLTVTAQYDATVRSYNVTFVYIDADGVTEKTVTRTVKYGSAATAPELPRRMDGWVFYTWDKDFSNITGDLTVTANYINDNVYLAGDFNGWNETTLPLELTDDEDVFVITVELTKGTYEFKLKRGDGWYGNTGTITNTTDVNGASNPWYMVATTQYDENNCTLVASGGYYTFTFSKSSQLLDVKYEPYKYTVKFVDYNGNELKTQTVTAGSNATAPADPTRNDGWVFIGWDKSFNDVSSDLTVTAQYRDDNVYLYGSFNNWSEGILMGPAGDNYITAVVRNLTAGNYTFKFKHGDTWYTNTGTVNDTAYQWSTVTSGSDCTLAASGGTYTFHFNKTTKLFDIEYAPFQYVVTFKDWDGSVIATQTVDIGKDATAPADPTRNDGWVFFGWDKTFTNIQSDITVTAQYYDNNVYVSGDFNNWGETVLGPAGSEIVSTTIELGTNSYEFKFKQNGTWYTNTGTVSDSAFNWETTTDSSADNIKLNATGGYYKINFNTTTKKFDVEYTPYVYTVTFVDWKGDTIKSEQVEIGKGATAPSVPPRDDGWVFLKWDKDFSYITADTTVTAMYMDNQMYLCCDSTDWHMEYTPMPLSNGKFQLTVELPVGQYFFKFTQADTWYTNLGTFNNECYQWDTITDKSLGDCTLNADGGYYTFTLDEATKKFDVSYVPYYYTVTFMHWDGTVIKEETVASNKSATAPANVASKDGYEFLEWDKSFTNITADTVVTARCYDNNIYLKGDFNQWGTANVMGTYGDTVVTTRVELAPGTYSFKFFQNGTYYTDRNAGTVSDTTGSDWWGTTTSDSVGNTVINATGGWYTFTFATDTKDFHIAYEPYTYTVTFKDFDGSVISTDTVAIGTAADAPADPTRYGYDFTGWDTDFSKITGNLTVTATYKIKSYTVTFSYLDTDGKTVVTKDVTVEHGSAATAPELPRRSDGWVFYKWDKDFSYVTENMTVTADYIDDNVYLAGDFNSWHEKNLPMNLTDNEDVVTITLELGTGSYEFKLKRGDGWYSNTGTIYDTTDYNGASNPWDMLAGDQFGNCTLNASGGFYTFTYNKTTQKLDVKYEPYTFTVNFVDYNGDVLSTQTVEIGNSAIAPATPVRENYDFTGWDTDFTNVQSDLTVTAQYKIHTYTVTFVYRDSDGETVVNHEVEIEHGKSATAPEVPKRRDGWVFLQWDREFSYITEDITVNAEYIDDNVYLAGDFNDWNEKTLPMKLTDNDDIVEITITLNAGTYEFKLHKGDGWFTNEGTITDTTDLNGASNPWDMVAGGEYDNCTLNARGGEYTFIYNKATQQLEVKYSPYKYTVTFVDYNGNVLKSDRVEIGTAATAPADPTRNDGWVFIGWDKDFSNITEDITVTAQYKNDNVYLVGSVTGSWDTNSSTTMNYGDVSSMTVTLQPGDYEFKFVYDGVWYTNTGIVPDTTDYNGNSNPWTTVDDYQNIRLSATGGTYTFTFNKSTKTFEVDYVPFTYTVTFVDHDGTVLKTETVAISKGATAPADPTREHYDFTGWDVDFSDIKGDLTVTAQYKVKSYKVTFVYYTADCELTSTEVMVEYGKGATAPELPRRSDGWVFSSWDTDFSNISGPVTVTANYIDDNVYIAGSFNNWHEKDTPMNLTDDENVVTITIEFEEGTYEFKLKRGDGWYSNQGQISDTTDWNGNSNPWDMTAGDEVPNCTLNATGGRYTFIYNKETQKLEVKYSPFIYNVVFKNYDGTVLSTQTVNRGEAAVAPATPTKPADQQYTYAFKAWDTDFSAVRTDLVVTATYEGILNKYPVTFVDYNGDVIKTEDVEYGSAATAPSAPTRNDGYVFSGWDKDFSNITDATTITAQYKDMNVYLLGEIFGSWDTSSTNMMKPTEEGSKIVTVTVKLAAGSYEFKLKQGDDWFGNDGDVDDTTVNTSAIGWEMSTTAGDCTLIALGGQYVFNYNTETHMLEILSVTPTYTVTFKDHDGTVIDTQVIREGDDATAPADPSRAADAQYTYTFSGWDKSFTNITADTVVNATYSMVVNKYTVQFVDHDGRVVDQQVVEYGSAATTPNVTLTREPDAQYTYTFSGWDADYSYITGDTTVTAKYSTVTNKYFVTFVDRDGTVLSVQEVEYGSAAIAPADPDPSRLNTAQYTYSFTGWDVDYTNITGTTTVTAQYKATTNQYTVTFKDWNGEVLKTQNVNYGGSATAPGNPYRAGYVFDGWDVPYNFITSDTVVTATYVDNNVYLVGDFNNWQLVDQMTGGNVVSVTLQLDQGFYPFKVRQGDDYYGKDVTIVDKTGGITTSSADGTPNCMLQATGGKYTFTFNKSTKVLTVSYVPDTYTVTFKNWDGTILSTQTVARGQSAVAPGTPTRPGTTQFHYIFSHWGDQNGNYLDYSNVQNDMILTAVFNEAVNNFTVVFKDYDGTVIDTQTVMYGASAVAPASPERAGYTFKQWIGNYSSVTSNTEVIADYTANSYTVTATVSGSGSVTPTRTTVTYPETVTLVASPSAGYSFKRWVIQGGTFEIVGGSATNRTLTIRPTSDVTVMAVFGQGVNLTVHSYSTNGYDNLYMWESNGTLTNYPAGDWPGTTQPNNTNFNGVTWDTSDKLEMTNGYSNEVGVILNGGTAIPSGSGNLVIFNNTLGWSNVYLYTSSSNLWNGNNGCTTNGATRYNMQRIGSTNYWYAYVSNTTSILFMKDIQDGYGNIWQTSASFRTDYNSAYPTFTPSTTSNQTTNSTTYYSNGSWSGTPAIGSQSDDILLQSILYNNGAWAGVSEVWIYQSGSTEIVTTRRDLLDLIEIMKDTYNGGVNSEGYTTDSWNNFVDAYENAYDISGKGTSSQTDIDTAASALQAAYDALVKVKYYSIFVTQVNGVGNVVVGNTTIQSVNGSATVVENSQVNVTVTAPADYYIKQLIVNGEVVFESEGLSTTSYTISSVISNTDIEVVYDSKPVYTIKVEAYDGTAGKLYYNGEAIPSTGKTIAVDAGDSVTITAVSSSGYTIKSWTVDGKTTGRDSAYTFSTITANHTIAIDFAKIESIKVTVNANPAAAGNASATNGIYTAISNGTKYYTGKQYEVITLKATITDRCYEFVGWSIKGEYEKYDSSTIASSIFRIVGMSDLTVTANYELTYRKIYLQNDAGWSQPSLYFWGSNTHISIWPGEEMTYDSSTGYWVGYIPVDTTDIQFNDGTNQNEVEFSDVTPNLYNNGNFTSGTYVEDGIYLQGSWDGVHHSAYDIIKFHENGDGTYSVTINVNSTIDGYIYVNPTDEASSFWQASFNGNTDNPQILNAPSGYTPNPNFVKVEIDTNDFNADCEVTFTFNPTTREFSWTTVKRVPTIDIIASDGMTTNSADITAGMITPNNRVGDTYFDRNTVNSVIVRDTYETADINAGTTVTFSTQVNMNAAGSYDYYVAGWVINGTEFVTANNAGNGLYTGSYTFTEDGTTVVPVYFHTDAWLAANNVDTVKVYAVADKSIENWNQYFSAYTWYNNGEVTNYEQFGYYPGQLMIPIAGSDGLYYTIVETTAPDGTAISGILFNNYAPNNNGEANANDTVVVDYSNLQTYDFYEFIALLNDGMENITFVLKHTNNDYNSDRVSENNDVTLDDFVFEQFVDYSGLKTDIFGNNIENIDMTLSDDNALYIIQAGDKEVYNDVLNGSYYVECYLYDADGTYLGKCYSYELHDRDSQLWSTLLADYEYERVYISYEYVNGPRYDGEWYGDASVSTEINVSVNVGVSIDNGENYTVDADAENNGVNVAPYGSAYINTNKQNIDVVRGTTVAISATPATGYKFIGWFTKDGELFSTNTTVNVDVAIGTTFTAVFQKLESGTYYVNHYIYTGVGESSYVPRPNGGSAQLFVGIDNVSKNTSTGLAHRETASIAAEEGDELIITIATDANGADKFYAWYVAAKDKYGLTTFEEVGVDSVDNIYDNNGTVIGRSDMVYFQFRYTVKADDSYSMTLFSDLIAVSADVKLHYQYTDRNGKTKDYYVNYTLTDEEIEGFAGNNFTPYTPAYITGDGWINTILVNAPYVEDLYKNTTWIISEAMYDTLNFVLWATQPDATYTATVMVGDDVTIHKVPFNTVLQLNALELSDEATTKGFWYSDVDGDGEYTEGVDTILTYGPVFANRITADMNLYYENTTELDFDITIEAPIYGREQSTDEEGNNKVDKVIVDFVFNILTPYFYDGTNFKPIYNGQVVTENWKGQHVTIESLEDAGYTVEYGIILEQVGSFAPGTDAYPTFDDALAAAKDKNYGTATDNGILTDVVENYTKPVMTSAGTYCTVFDGSNYHISNKNRVQVSFSYNNTAANQKKFFNVYSYVTVTTPDGVTTTYISNVQTLNIYTIGTAEVVENNTANI